MSWDPKNDPILRTQWLRGDKLKDIANFFGASEEMISYHTKKLGLPRRRIGGHKIKDLSDDVLIMDSNTDDRRMRRDADRGSEALLSSLRQHHKIEEVINVR